MKIKPIHPFPARMAPDLAIDDLKRLTKQSIILDPMNGSGTVVRHASEMGHYGIGFDMDPLAVLMTKVWTTPIDYKSIKKELVIVIDKIRNTPDDIVLEWIDNDPETLDFTHFWFGSKQRTDLRKIAYVLQQKLDNAKDVEQESVINIFRLALSKLIITKKGGASLAWDISHSRPHKVIESSEYQVMPEFEKSIEKTCKILKDVPPKGNVKVKIGDARLLTDVSDQSVDLVITSPPYLNAIDYMRGHKMSLVWLGYKLSDLRYIRSESIGAEKSIGIQKNPKIYESIAHSMGSINSLSTRHQNMILRYAKDLYQMMGEISRVVNADGKATLVVGNSCLKGTFIRNSDGVIMAAKAAGLNLVYQYERDLPNSSRYLPIVKDTENPLSKRMRTETILHFTH